MEPEGRVLLIAAHPDDEVIGAGIRMTCWDPRRLTIVHLTAGSPRHPRHAQAAGFADPMEYAEARRLELAEALELAGIPAQNRICLDFVDQESYLHLPELVEKLAATVNELRPDVVYTHPYEGGHPDHDAAAFAVAHTPGINNRREFTSYHAGTNGLVTGEFLGGGQVQTHVLNSAERDLKRRMFDCFRSQQRVLRDFTIVHERFRDAPRYDFTLPPHSGRLHYENLGWNISGESWRTRAGEALKLLQVENVL